jgi:kumamolisin
MSQKSGFLNLILITTALFFLGGCGGGSGEIEDPTTCTEPAVSRPLSQAGVEIPNSGRHKAGYAHTNHLILSKAHSRLIGFEGYTPDQIRTAYGIPDNGGSGTIVIVVAHDNPTALADFNAFSAEFGLPQETSSDVTDSDNEHLQIIYHGGARPSYDPGWSQESAMDMQWAHAMAPNAKIVVIETSSGNLANLMSAADLAATIPNAGHSSNSWSAAGVSITPDTEKHFQHAGMVYFFSSGDAGGVVEYPAASPNVVAVGGTSLTLGPQDQRVAETAWSGTGCGISACETRPSFQNPISSIVGTARGVADVSAVADPQTGVRVRWQGDWYIFGGTSAACPIIAGIANTAGTNRTTSKDQNAFIYSRLGTSSFFDVTAGSAGIRQAMTGWDFPTGVGTPNGIGGF